MKKSMNKIYTITSAILLMGAGITTLSAQTAAKDTTLNRQVYLEREYTPTIQDASKVNTLPALHQPQKKQYDIKFENAIPSVNLTSFPVGDTGSGDIKTNIDYSKHRGYLVFGAGMYTNLEGALGYRVVDGQNDQLDIFATHSFTDARIKYQLDDSPQDKIKAKDMENLVKLRYSHTFKPLTWYLGGSFMNQSYNFYGNPYVVNYVAGVTFPEENLEKKQSANIFEVETGIQSKESEAVIYSGNIRYNRFSTKYGPDIAYDGVSANLIDAAVNIAYPIDLFSSDNFRLGVKGGIFHQSADKVDFALPDEDPFHSLTLVKANPYISFGGQDDAFSLSLGANLNYAFDINDKTLIAPTANLSWNFQEKSVFYATLEGGINSNNLVETFRENKYVNPGQRIAISQTPYDVQVGVKSGVIDGFEFDIFGGYKYTKDEHLYTQSSTAYWGNVSEAMYANLGTGHFGGLLKTRLIPHTDLALKVVGYFYNLSEYKYMETEPSEKKAWGLPSLTFGFNADFSFIDNLILTASYDFEGGRKTWQNNTSKKMDAINELSFKANYQIFDWLSVYGKANNVLNQKYERYYGYTLQGINVVLGASLKF